MSPTAPDSNPPASGRISSATAPTAGSNRLMSLDALRGFDMFWIIGADALVYALDRIHRGGAAAAAADTGGFSLLNFLARQMEHCEWAGFHFYDLIFPLFVFMVGASTVFSLTKAIEQAGPTGALKRVFRRALLLYVVGVLYSGGFRNNWPDIRLLGVLNRIAICYFFAGLIFCYFHKSIKTMVGIAVSILIGYWAIMSLTPIRDIRLNDDAFKRLSADTGIKDPRAIFNTVTNRVHGVFDPGYNLSDHTDFQYLPGMKYDKYYDPEGYLSTLPAVVTCLLGVFAGLLLKNQAVPDSKKVVALIGGGIALVALGWLWSLHFPVVKKIWTSSFVLVAGGYSAILMGVFYQLVDVWKYQGWCQPFVWMGMNSITIYITNNLISGFRKQALRFAGGDVKNFLDTHVLQGSGDLLVSLFGLFLAFAFVRFLYQRKIFLRL